MFLEGRPRGKAPFISRGIVRAYSLLLSRPGFITVDVNRDHSGSLSFLL